MIPNNLIQEIREKANIVDIVNKFTTLEKKGRNHKGFCPLHNEKRPSFYILPNEKNFKCFGCGIGGDVFKFLMEKENITFPEAVRYVAKEYNITIPTKKVTPEEEKEYKERESLFIITDVINDYFQKQLAKSEDVKKYLKERGIDDDSIAKFQIGFKGRTNLTTYLLNKQYNIEFLQKLSLTNEDKKDRIWNRIIFPIHNYSRIVGFAHREFKNNPKFKNKYINPENSEIYNKKEILYGLNHAYISIKQLNECIIVEGYIDVILLHQYGFTNSVALCSKDISIEQSKLIKKYCSKATLLLDGDNAGIKGINRAIPILLRNNLEVDVVTLDNGKDPADYLSDEKIDFNQVLQTKKQSFYQYKSQEINAITDIATKSILIKDLIDTVFNITDDITRNLYINQIEKDFNISQKDILQQMRQSKSKSLETIIDLSKEELKQTLKFIETQQNTSIKNR